MLYWFIWLDRVGRMAMEMVGACDDLERDIMREEADLRKEGRGLVIVALITHHHEPSSCKSIVLNFISAFISCVSPAVVFHHSCFNTANPHTSVHTALRNPLYF